MLMGRPIIISHPIVAISSTIFMTKTAITYVPPMAASQAAAIKTALNFPAQSKK
jgi:hypothetical protein